jgi:hypothetical protein
MVCIVVCQVSGNGRISFFSYFHPVLQSLQSSKRYLGIWWWCPHVHAGDSISVEGISDM